MFGSLKRIFKRSASKEEEAAASSPFAAPREQGNANSFSGVTAPPPAEPELVAPSSSDSVVLPFSMILKLLPREMYGKGWATPGASHFTISKSQVLEQLAHGTVKVPFGELRQAAPAGLLVNSSSHDGKLIELPLGEIMRQVQLDSLSKRSAQKRVDVPVEIADLFGQKGEPIAQVRVVGKKEAAAAAVPSASTTTFTAKAPASAGRGAAVRGGSATPVVAPPPPIRMPQTPFAFPSASAAGAKPKAPVVTATTAAQKARITSAKEPERSTGEPALVVPLAAISEHWPDAIRAEISQLNLANATCELPLGEIGPSLRAGKVQCRWKQIRSWVQPPISNFSPSNQAEAMIELPLKILAPLYVQHCRSTRAPKKAAVSESIPDVFNRAVPEPVAPEEVEEPSFDLDAEPAELAEPEAPSAQPPAQAVTAERAAYLALPLALVSENWPEQVRKEIDFFNLGASKLEIPFEVIEEGLKQGRLNFRWRQICLWLNPPPSSEMASANLATQLDFRVELPLSFIAPLYLQQRSAAGARKQSADAASIPDLISREGEPVSAETTDEDSEQAITAASQAAPAAKAVQVAPAKSGKKSGEQLAELLGEPSKRNWTPNDIVHKTATLGGVSGALIALQDGLLVAACMPPNWKPETVAAFLPQIFGRMRQYTNEFKVGDLQSLSFTVPEGTLQVYSAGLIYFAALGKLDRELPLAELSLIAKEIGRHTKQ